MAETMPPVSGEHVAKPKAGEPAAPQSVVAPDSVLPALPKPEALAGAPADEDATMSPEAVGDVGCKTLYVLTGAVIGDYKAATATGAEHAALSKTLAAYAKHRGILFRGTLALIGMFVAYAVAEDRRGLIVGKIKGWLGWKKAEPRKVEPVAPVVDVTPAPSTPPIVKDPFA
jgi:hypothetical protein